MVLRGSMRRRPERAKTLLHNFTLPNLKWGSQRHLKCSRIDSISNGGSGDHRLRRRSPPLNRRGAPFESVEEGIEEFRVKIMLDLKTVRDKITQSMFRRDVIEEEQDDESGHGEVPPAKPWNLRKRRAEEPVAIEERIVVEAERRKFSVKLTRKEIEEDFMAALGHRPPRRPKKRPRNVQKKLDSLHPGFYLTEVTLDAYKVEETKR